VIFQTLTTYRKSGRLLILRVIGIFRQSSTNHPERSVEEYESRLARLSQFFRLAAQRKTRVCFYGSMVPKLSVRTSVPVGCWMCNTTLVNVSDVSTTLQFPFGHSVEGDGDGGGGIVTEKVI